MKLVSVAEMQAVEKEADASGLTYEKMMENAGTNLAEVIHEVYGYLAEQGALGLVGSGNNGGDSLVALARLAQQGWKTCAYIVRPRTVDDPLVNRLKQAGGSIYTIEEDARLNKLAALLNEYQVMLDGILGTGMRLPLKPDLAKLLGFIRAKILAMDDPPSVVAVDCPSGIDCDSGQAAEECIPAEMTVTMAAVKQGLFKFPAFDLSGELRLVGIGLPEGDQELQAWQDIRCEIVEEDWVRKVLPARPNNAHKGTFGTALVVAGSVNYSGAALLAGQAAYRVGTGLVTLGVVQPLYATLAGHFPEATWLILPEALGVIAEEAAEVVWKNLERVNALLIGPGFGLEETTEKFLSQLLRGQHRQGVSKLGFIQPGKRDISHPAQDDVQKIPAHAQPAKGSIQGKTQDESRCLPPLVVDADGLKLLKRLPDWAKLLPTPAILTPHPGEMAILTGLSTETIQADRLNIARQYSQEWGHVVVLKGAFSVVAEPGGKSVVIPVATPALARAGTGDVLAGLIVGLRAQGVSAFEAAAAGAWIHAQAGVLAEQRLGNTAAVLAGDVLRSIMDVMTEIQ